MGFRRFDRGRRREPQKRVNHRIRVPEIRVIDEKGEMLGVMATQEALKRARSLGLDLVEINPKASPPVCKILDFGKFKYDEKKKARETKRKQSTVEVKEVKLRPKTDDHDLEFKARAARKFLESGNKVKFTVRFRGREITHPEKAREQLEWILDQCRDICNLEVRPTMEGRTMNMMVAPKPTVMQQLAADKAEAEKQRKEAEEARRAEKGNRSSPGSSSAGPSYPGDSEEGYSEPGDSEESYSEPGEESGEPPSAKGRKSGKGKPASEKGRKSGKGEPASEKDRKSSKGKARASARGGDASAKSSGGEGSKSKRGKKAGEEAGAD